MRIITNIYWNIKQFFTAPAPAVSAAPTRSILLVYGNECRVLEVSR